MMALDAGNIQVFRPLTWTEFIAPHTTDAMAVMYAVPGEDAYPRLGTAALAPLIAAGQEPVLTWVLLEFDREGHAPWEDGEGGEVAGITLAALLAMVGDLHPALSGVGGYTTRAGLRLVWELADGIPARYANAWLADLGAMVGVAAQGLGVFLDPASYEWTRLMRTPRARREGRQLDPIVVEPGAPLPPSALAFDLREDRAARETARASGARPRAPRDLTHEDWAAVWTYPQIRAGAPIPEDASGHVYPMLRTILASIAAAGEIEDPEILISLVWASVEHTPRVSLDEAWGLAEWVTRQQKVANLKYAEVLGSPSPPTVTSPTADDWGEMFARIGKSKRRLGLMLSQGLPFARKEARGREVMVEVADLIINATHVPSLVAAWGYMRASAEASAEACGITAGDVWDAVKGIWAARHAQDNEAATRTSFLMVYPLTIKTVAASGGLYQLDTTNTPYVYRPTDEQSISHHYELYTKPNLPFRANYGATESIRNLLSRYGATVDRILFTSGQAGTSYDKRAGAMIQGVHVLADAQPRFHADVDGWLRLLGGTDVEGVLDWLAAITFTQSEPICALYLDGPKGTGKSLLGAGIASLWGAAPISYASVMGDFNGGLLTCPLVFADEGITIDRFQEASASEQFRNLVANTAHTINAKYQPPGTLNAALRVLVTSNGPQGIPFKKAMSQDGIDAVTDRILYAHMDRRAAAYLLSLGGRPAMRDWILPNNQPGKIAEHLLWLRDTRELKHGGRFLVQGRATKWHLGFAADQGHKSAVLQVASKLLDRAERNAMGAASGVQSEPGTKQVWVAPSAVYDAWSKYADYSRPSPAIVQETVIMLAAGDPRQIRFGGKRKTCYPILYETFVAASVREWGDFGVTDENVPELEG